MQASLIGSILANLLLILGMSFLLGGLRFREQVSLERDFPSCTKPSMPANDGPQLYNSTVTNTSVSLLSLSVSSLLLPVSTRRGFHLSRVCMCKLLIVNDRRCSTGPSPTSSWQSGSP